MLYFFRKYQKTILIIMTMVVITTFVFFGTYQAMAPTFHKKEKDEVIFTTLDGKKIYTNYLKSFVNFISGDQVSGRQARGVFAGNFLNDSVVEKEFLKTGFIIQILNENPELYQGELQERFEKEKHYKPYRHPSARLLNAEGVWTHFAPMIIEKLKALQQFQSPVNESAFQTRVDLFLAEQQFPPALLSQVLRYQEKENPSIMPDPRLWREDLSLFGYRSLTDWFGSEIMNSIAQVIIHGAAFARSKGYHVSDEEVLNDLIGRCQKVLESMRDAPPISPYQFFVSYIQNLGLDEAAVIAIWRDVTLYKRLIQDVGNSVFLDDHSIHSFYSCANQNATIELYQVPEPFRFTNFTGMRLFETYLHAALAPGQNPLMPLEMASIDEVEKKAPDLVGYHYTIEFAKVQKSDLLNRVSLKEMWDWEVEDENWSVLTKQFAELEANDSLADAKLGREDEKEKRFQLLEKVTPHIRKNIDAYARTQILAEHPERIEAEVSHLIGEEKRFFSQEKIMRSFFPGIANFAALLRLLEERGSLPCYTEDGNTYYKIVFKSKSEKALLSFSEGVASGILEEMASKMDESVFQKTVNDLANILRKDNLVPSNINSDELRDLCAAYRFYPFLVDYQNAHTDKSALALQWQPQKKEKTVSRAESDSLSMDEVLAMNINHFSKVQLSPKNGLFFYRVLDKKMDTSLPIDKMLQAQELLSKEAQKHYFEKILEVSRSTKRTQHA